MPATIIPDESWSAVHGPIEQLELRPGMSLVLSDFTSSGATTYAHVEQSDVAGIGFHLKGGAQFETGERAFLTQAGDVWAVRARAGEASRFTLPGSGFRTAALRLNPETADELLPLLLPGTASTTVRLPGLNAQSRQAVLQMFAAPYAGAARHLFLESRALELLASQIAATQNF